MKKEAGFIHRWRYTHSSVPKHVLPGAGKAVHRRQTKKVLRVSIAGAIYLRFQGHIRHLYDSSYTDF